MRALPNSSNICPSGVIVSFELGFIRVEQSGYPPAISQRVKAGLPAKEIARLRCEMVIDAAVPIIDAGVREWLPVEGESNFNIASWNRKLSPVREEP
jgi:hypothetical protein